MSSNKSFGLVFTLFFVWMAIYSKRSEFFGIAAIFLFLALFFPSVLGPLNKLWDRLGRILQMLVSPIVLMIIFFLVITPLAVLARLFGNRFLNLKIEKNRATYWQEKTNAVNMKEQF